MPVVHNIWVHFSSAADLGMLTLFWLEQLMEKPD